MSEDKNKQQASRREFFRRTLSIIPVAIIPSVIVSAPTYASAGEGIKNEYLPYFFNDIEWAFILAAVDRLIPTDENGPGAVSEDVPIFIDKQMEMPYGWGQLWYMHPPFAKSIPQLGYQSHLVPREVYRQGIRMINNYCMQHFGNLFHLLSIKNQDVILSKLEEDEISDPAISGNLFFTQLLDNTKEGYLADPIHGGNKTLASWKLIGFPGARADFMDMVKQPGKPYPYGPVSISRKRGS
ncbi:gluconate 2-dehydrogenase subunit 3 family protein [Scandinavium sp. NPDC088450]|uniref:gluconate 2-dehydrogenase subunit 3 family protein n=1 Tax=Scandinavium sp. NPDC088450 TaxID=3364514 RepID=UPI00384A5165